MNTTLTRSLIFLTLKEDVRSSYYLENVATEFDVQGLELDWVRVTWGDQLFVVAVFRDETRAHGMLRVGLGLKGLL